MSAFSFLDSNNNCRAIVNLDRAVEARANDPHAHASHVASIAASTGRVSKGLDKGLAPNAKLINLRVLNSVAIDDEIDDIG